MLRAKAFAKESAGNRLCVVEKFMLPQCIVQECFVFVLCMLLGRQFASRASRRVRHAERAAQARVRAARHIDLPLLLARAAEQGATAAGGDSMI